MEASFKPSFGNPWASNSEETSFSNRDCSAKISDSKLVVELQMSEAQFLHELGPAGFSTKCAMRKTSRQAWWNVFTGDLLLCVR